MLKCDLPVAVTILDKHNLPKLATPKQLSCGPCQYWTHCLNIYLTSSSQDTVNTSQWLMTKTAWTRESDHLTCFYAYLVKWSRNLLHFTRPDRSLGTNMSLIHLEYPKDCKNIHPEGMNWVRSLKRNSWKCDVVSTFVTARPSPWDSFV